MYTTYKHDFNLKAISQVMGHATEIISMDTYGDNEEIISDCVNELTPFIERVTPKDGLEVDFSDDQEIINNIESYFNNLRITE